MWPYKNTPTICMTIFQIQLCYSKQMANKTLYLPLFTKFHVLMERKNTQYSNLNFCVYECFACIRLCTTCMISANRSQKRASELLKLGYRWWSAAMWVLEIKPTISGRVVLLTTEPSFQPINTSKFTECAMSERGRRNLH